MVKFLGAEGLNLSQVLISRASTMMVSRVIKIFFLECTGLARSISFAIIDTCKYNSLDEILRNIYSTFAFSHAVTLVRELRKYN